ncbi:MAG: hypothetical protein M3O30_07555 [Planctomycetota bacterium]|nr:hypothetical protein [Planctomycetota bacterium]
MRAAFGLAGILVSLGVIVLIMRSFYLPHTEAVLKARDQAQQETSQWSGRDAETGKPIEQTYALFPDNRSDGKLADFQVSHIDADSPMAKMFGLKENDVILAAWDSHDVRTDIVGSADPDSAKLSIRDAYTGAGKLFVQRDDKKMILPGEKPADDRGNLLETTPANQSPQAKDAQPPAAKPDAPADDNDPLKALHDRSKFIPNGM